MRQNLIGELEQKLVEQLELENLPTESEKTHIRLIEQLSQLTGKTIQKVNIYHSKHSKIKEVAYSLANPQIIILRSPIALLDGNESNYLFFRAFNRNKHVQPSDYLSEILAHEYSHQMFNNNYRKQIEKLSTKVDGIEAKKCVNSITEAFAYWLSETSTGFRELTENVCA